MDHTKTRNDEQSTADIFKMNNLSADSIVATRPPVQGEDGGSIPTSALQNIPTQKLFIEKCPLPYIRKFVEINHYSRSVNGVKISLCFSVKCGPELIGGVIFGALSTTAWKRFSESEKEVLELRRLVLLDAAGKNSESYVIGYTLRWIKKNFPQVSKIVSYADPKHGHSGVIYRASNFQYWGVTNKDVGYHDPETDKTYHSRALRTRNSKGQYKPFVCKLRKKLSDGLLTKIILPGKHCYVYSFR